MEFIFKKATIEDLELLISSRIEVLRATNELSDETDMEEIRKNSKDYYECALKEDTHSAYLVLREEQFIGSGGISYYSVMPTYHNPTGRKAYIMNMYVRPEYRRKGIAREMLNRLVQDATERGVTQITLEATKAGRPLYEKYGFVPMESEYILPCK